MGLQCTALFRSEILGPLEKNIGNLSDLKTQFGISTSSDDLDFITGVSTAAIYNVMFGYKDEFCSALSALNPMQGFIAVTKNTLTQIFNFNFDKLVGLGEQDNKTTDNESGVGQLQWNYQMCAELGMIDNQNSDLARSVGSLLTAHNGERDCKMAFGELKTLPIAELNKKYYEPLLNSKMTSNVVIVNEGGDYLSANSISKDHGNWTNPKIDVLLVPGGSHCEGMGVSPNDPPAVTTMRTAVISDVQKWLAH